jgi:hypothetical protein
VLGFARSINLLSALATATSCAVLASCVARWTASRSGGIAAGVAAGAMLSVWRSANETEVYALSLLLAVTTLAIADRAGVSRRWRDAALAIYVLALAIPLHLSALVIAPAVVLFAATTTDGSVAWPKALLLAGAVALAMALGTLSLAFAGIAALLFVAGIVWRGAAPESGRVGYAAALGVLVVLAASAVLFMYVRAQYDPFVNQGNPNTIDALLSVVGREQYDVPPLWPRRAPLWLQVGTLVQYADWQVAFGLDHWVGASLRRTPFTIAFVALGMAGARWHSARDRRSFRIMALAIASASLGAIVVLNLRAGPSFGIGVLPADAQHEARERDYFFALAFALAAAWAGMGATRFAEWMVRRLRVFGSGAVVALVVAAAPIALNWRAANRRGDRPQTLAHRLAAAMLEASPPTAVLFVGGDNDTYPLWYLQEVEGRRRDITLVTIPLLPAQWYRAELMRRGGLLSDAQSWRGTEAVIASIADHARRAQRPIAVAVSVPARHREALGGDWLGLGMVYARRDEAAPATAVAVATTGDSLHVAASGTLMVDTAIVARAAARIAPATVADPTRAYVETLLSCPDQILRAIRARRGSVDPRCNLR